MIDRRSATNFNPRSDGLRAQHPQQPGAGQIHGGVFSAMSGGYRGVILAAIIGLAIICYGSGYMLGALNYPEQERYQSYRNTDQNAAGSEATISSHLTKPEQYRTPCREPQGRSESELCAEWKSAVAAEDSAAWAQRGFWIAFVGAAILIWQVILTRRAVEETDEATNAMREANTIARTNGEIELRAYLGFDFLKWISDPSKDTASHKMVGFCVPFKNFGVTPARDIKRVIHITMSLGEERASRFFAHNALVGTLAPSDDARINCSAPFPRHIVEHLEAGKAHVLIVAIVTYVDVFKNPQRLEAKFEGNRTDNIGLVTGSMVCT